MVRVEGLHGREILMWRLRATAGCTGAAAFLGHVIELCLNTILSRNKGTPI